jgi:hypothetical protein
MRFLGIEANTVTVYSYSSKSETLPSDHLMRFLGIEANLATITKHPKINKSLTPEPAILLMSFSSSSGEIT